MTIGCASRNQEEERECDRTIGSFGHQSEITREQLSLPLASPPSPSGIRGILWVVQSIDLWLVSPSLDDTMKYSDRHLAGLSARPPRPRRTQRRGLSRLRDRPQLRLRADKLPSPNHCESRDFLLVFKNLSHNQGVGRFVRMHEPDGSQQWDGCRRLRAAARCGLPALSKVGSGGGSVSYPLT